MKKLQMTRAQFEEHQRKHGFYVDDVVVRKPSKQTPMVWHALTMNKTEREYAFILEAMKGRGEILRYEYEGITLRWHGIRYTPDFYVLLYPNRVTLIEIKGGYIKGVFERAVERFRHARTYWPEFQFELHQKKGGQWQRIE